MPSGGQPSTILVDRPAACTGMERDGDIIIRSRTSEKRSDPTVGSFRCEHGRTRRQPARRSPEEARRSPEEARKKPTRVNDRVRNVEWCVFLYSCTLYTLYSVVLCPPESCIRMLAAAGLTSPFLFNSLSQPAYYGRVSSRITETASYSTDHRPPSPSLSLSYTPYRLVPHSNGRHAVGR